MFEKLRIKEHMEIVGSDGEHVGTVDHVDGETIKIFNNDSSYHENHTLPFDLVDRVEDNRIYLNVPKAQASAAKA